MFEMITCEVPKGHFNLFCNLLLEKHNGTGWMIQGGYDFCKSFSKGTRWMIKTDGVDHL